MGRALRGAAAAILEAGEAAMLRVGRELEGEVRQAATSRGEAGFPFCYGPRNKAVPSKAVSDEGLWHAAP